MAEQFAMPPDAEGRSLFFRASDLKARMWISYRSEEQFEAGEFEGAAMLFHAMVYLADRLSYMLAPWPKGKIKIEVEAPHADR